LGAYIKRIGTILPADVSHRTDGNMRVLTDDDGELVSRCRRGDLNAFEVLVRKHQKKMLNIAYRMIGDYDDACEVVQEAFLSAYRSVGKFKGDAQFSTWLTSITMNHAKNHMRQARSRSRHEVISLDDPVDTASGETTYDPPSQEISIVEQLEQREVQTHVQRCIRALEEDYREVLVLRDMEGFSYGEIVGILKIPDGTVKSRLFRARNAVKECLKRVIAGL
jgi:RNA polymerase sigma-70 factor, ECF subfamily